MNLSVTAFPTPAALLLDPLLSPAAKLLWMVLRVQAQSGPVGPAALQRHSGLARPTILRALAQLAAAGWCSLAPLNQATPILRVPGGLRVTVPGSLLKDYRVGSRGKVLYGVLQLLLRSEIGGPQFTFARLRELTHASINAIKRALRDLVECGWLYTQQVNQLTPIRFRLANPVRERIQTELARMRRRLTRGQFKGEALMRECLSLLFASTHFQDNANPGFLENAATGERLQLDRYYTCGVAFEFNGPQHYVTTQRFPDHAKLVQQQAWDRLKHEICQREGIPIVVLHGEDLSLEGVRKKVGNLLPHRDLTGLEDLVEYLEYRGRLYRAKAGSGREWRPAAACHRCELASSGSKLLLPA